MFPQQTSVIGINTFGIERSQPFAVPHSKHQIMKQPYFWISALFIVCSATVAHSQAAGNFLYNNPHSFNNEKMNIPVTHHGSNQVTLKAEVMMNIRATSYTVIFSASQSGPDAAMVDSMMNFRLSLVKHGLALLGIKESDIHIDAVSMVPTYSHKLEEKRFSKRATEIPEGFEMKKNIHVLFRHHEQLDQIISYMAYADIYDMVKVDYNIDGSQTYLEELRKAALSVVHDKEGIYGSLGMHLTVASLGEGFTMTYPLERYKQFTAFHSGTSAQLLKSLTASSNSTAVNVSGKNNTIRIDGQSKDTNQQQFQILSAEKSKTIFYDRIPYNQFDKVIHADMEEPCIQLLYSIQVNYVVLTAEQHEQVHKAKESALQPAKQGRRASRKLR